jgi:hypothetical protein
MDTPTLGLPLRAALIVHQSSDEPYHPFQSLQIMATVIYGHSQFTVIADWGQENNAGHPLREDYETCPQQESSRRLAKIKRSLCFDDSVRYRSHGPRPLIL